MADAKNEPRGLTIPDLMILVAGTALAMSLPERNHRPPLFARPGQFSDFGNMWSVYLHEQLSRLCLVLGILGWSRCTRHRRPINAPELLALALGWHNLFLSMIDWDNGWVRLNDYVHMSPLAWSSVRNSERFLLWHGDWAMVGLFSVALLVIGPIRRRIPVGLIPLLLVLGWHGLGYALPVGLNEIPMTGVYGGGMRWSLGIFHIIIFQLPVAATLLAFRRHPLSGWPSPTWLALAVGIATMGVSIADRLTDSISNRRGPWYLPSPQWVWEYPYLAVPPTVLLLEILLLAWATRTRRTQEEPPA